MAVENSPLTREIDAIMNQGPTAVHYQWRAEVSANGQTIKPLKLLSIDLVRNYAQAYSDEIVVECVFGAGTFSHDIFPYKNDLQITLFRDPLGEVGTDSDLTKDIESQPLRATLVNPASSVIEGNGAAAQDKESADLVDLVNIQFQLVDLALEQIRMLTSGTVFRNTTSPEALRYFLTDISQKIDVDDEHKVLGVDMVESPNADTQDHIVIPHGTRFTEVPEMLHQSASGIYPSGFGYYLQKNLWYVYPLYDLTRFDKADRTLTLINVPKNRYPQVERTYRTTANQVIVLVTGGVRHKDDSESMQLNHGNGVRFADARRMLDDFVTVKDNKAIAARTLNGSEFVAEQRQTGLNNVQTSPRRISSNMFLELSKMARRAGSHLQVKWENAELGLIFPGMPVKYLYLVKDQVVEVKGVVQGIHGYTGTDGPGLTSARHITNAVLTLFVDRNIDWSAVTGEADTSS